MYRTTSVLALGLFLGLAPTAVFAQDTQQQDTQQQDTQQQDTDQLDIQLQDDQQQQQTQQQQTQQQQTQQQQTQQQQTQQQQTSGLLATEQQSLMVDSMVGADVYSAAQDETIGSIDDVLITVNGEVEGVIIGVGGWLGVGQRDVRVSMQDLSLETRGDELRLVMQRTREELEAEPEFRRVDEQQQARTGQQGDMPPTTTEQETTRQEMTQQQARTSQQGDMPPTTTEQETTRQEMTQQQTAQQEMGQQSTTGQQTAEQAQQPLSQTDLLLQQANRALQVGDAQLARESLDEAGQRLEQSYQQVQSAGQQTLEQVEQLVQQADGDIQVGNTQQAQQNIEQARSQLQTAQQETGQETGQQAGAQQGMTQQQTGQQAGTQQGTAQQDTMQPQPREDQIVFQDEDSILASTMIGTDVQLGSDEELGQISDVVVTMDGQVEGVVLGVGGFLGLGEKDVVVAMDRLDIQRTEEDDVRVTVLDTREDLEAAESFQQPQQNQPLPATEGTEAPELRQ